MYPYSQASAYEIKNGVFSPCPSSLSSSASRCPPCLDSSTSELSVALVQIGLFKFAKIVEISGLKNICTGGCTVFAPRDDDIDPDYVQHCTRLDAVKIVKSSIMPNIIPIQVLLQSGGKTKYPTINIMDTMTVGEVTVYIKHRRVVISGSQPRYIRTSAKALAIMNENVLTDHAHDKFSNSSLVSIGGEKGIIEATYPAGSNVIVEPNLQGDNKNVLVHIVQTLILKDCV
jgi:hypothetical protein